MLVPTLNLPTITQEVALNTIRFNRQLGFTQTKIAMFSKVMADVGVSMSLAVSIPLQLMATAAVRSFAQLEDAGIRAASRVAGATKETGMEIARFSQMIAQQTPITDVGVAQGMEELLKAGASRGTAMQGIGHFTKFATAANLELDQSIHSLVGTFNAFGLATGDAQKDLEQLRRVSDVTLKAADISIASFEGMVEAMATGSAASKVYNIDLEETAAILATYSQRLIEGTEAGTKFQMAIRDITTANVKNREVWDQLVGPGAVYDQATGELRKFADIIETLEIATHGMTEEARKNFFIMLELPSRSFHSIAALSGLTNTIRDFEEQIRKSGGYVDSVFKVQMQSFSNQMKLLRNQLNSFLFSIGQSLVPVLKEASKAVTLLVHWWNQLELAQQQQIIQWFAIAAAMGPVLIIVSVLMRAIGFLGSVVWLLIRPLMLATLWFLKFAAAQIASGLASLVAMGPWGVAAAGILVAAGALLVWWKGADMAAFATEKLTGVLETMNKVVQDSIKGLAGGAFDVDIKAMELKMKQHQSIMDAVVGGAGKLTESQKIAVIESGVRSGVLTAFEGKLLQDMAKAAESGFTAATPPGFGDEDFSFDDEKDKSTPSHKFHPFSATELGSVEEHKARVSGQQQLVTVARLSLEVQKDIKDEVASTNKKMEGLVNNSNDIVWGAANI